EAFGSSMSARGRGGGSGIRTHVTVSRKHAFQACAFSHSATPPDRPVDRAATVYIKYSTRAVALHHPAIIWLIERRAPAPAPAEPLGLAFASGGRLSRCRRRRAL